MKVNLHPNTQAILEKLTPEQCEKILNTKYTASDIKSQMERLEEIKKQLCKPGQVTIEGWVARDKNNDLSLYQTYPERQSNLGYWRDGFDEIELPKDSFPSVTWESEPLKVKITITPME